VLDYGEDPRAFIFEGRPAIVSAVYQSGYGFRNHLYCIGDGGFSRYILIAPEALAIGKNWSPFTYEDGSLGIVHGFDPVVILKERRREHGVIVLEDWHGFGAVLETGPGGFSAFRGGTCGITLGRHVFGIGHTTRFLPGASDSLAHEHGFEFHFHRPFGWLLDTESAAIRILEAVGDFPEQFNTIDPTSLIRLSDTEFELFTTQVTRHFHDRESKCEIASYRFSFDPRNLLCGRSPATARLSPKLFRSNIGRFESGEWVCDLKNVDGHVIYGPYRRMPVGTYEVSFILAAEGFAARPDAELSLDVAENIDRLLAVKPISNVSGPELAAKLRFDHRNIEDVIEFRVHARGFEKGTLRFRGVVIERIFQ